MNGVDIDLDAIDMGKLTKDQNKDIKEIQRLEFEMDKLTAGNMTMGDVNDIDKNFSMRPTVLSNESQMRQINNLQYEIDKYQKEIQLLKLKLQFKHQIMHYKQMEKDQSPHDLNQLNVQTDPCTIF